MVKLTNKEEIRRINCAKALLAEIGNSLTFRKEIELAEELAKKEGIEAYWKLQSKLSRELSTHLVNYKGIDNATEFCIHLAHILNGIETPEEKWYRIRESIKEFLKADNHICDYEPLNNLLEKAIIENTMDGYYNLLKIFRKNHAELVSLKGSEEKADEFLKNLTDVVHDRIKKTVE
ncbi:MAG: hypothetical protein I3273_04910 [Candidatus Moeniiplasma glomeromycotorum]|nr:hypothetical protein [Candidatus Moeniiplasma glomeromycotorum]MCE8167882.1 hypothetical protein [Candidatus Moeniiplasma glomeromycotorum]MCE8169307.1 hypothetical protein [Candidatus Moeniiplasma glomeromycotorum]MCE8169432.1 hypothetical protein [Candidatus Moeniiplasma glomeromycotorum]